jgi:hypothetical protein
MQRLSLSPDAVKESADLERATFSYNGVCSEDARIALEER